MPAKIYLDESGDLGWKFNAQFRSGGSSRYLTITFLITPENKYHLPKRIVKRVYRRFRFDPVTEIKGSYLNHAQKTDFAFKTKELLLREPQIQLGAITVKKENVQEHMRNDPNLLYNYITI